MPVDTLDAARATFPEMLGRRKVSNAGGAMAELANIFCLGPFYRSIGSQSRQGVVGVKLGVKDLRDRLNLDSAADTQH